MSAGAAVSWGGKLQDVVALSTTEGEYMAISHALQEGLYLRMLEVEMGVEPDMGGTMLLLDNHSPIKLAKNPVFHKRSKHITIRFYLIRERVEREEFCLEFVRTMSYKPLLLNDHVNMRLPHPFAQVPNHPDY